MRIIIEVSTPGNGKTYELVIDDKLTVGAAKDKIIEQITTFENGNIVFDGNSMLFSPVTRTYLADSNNLRKAGIRSGQLVYLL
jgi:hypothetical protein